MILQPFLLVNDLKDILEDYQAGLVCINGEDEVLAENAKKLLVDLNLRRCLGDNARALLEDKFSVSKAADQNLHILIKGHQASHFNNPETKKNLRVASLGRSLTGVTKFEKIIVETPDQGVLP